MIQKDGTGILVTWVSRMNAEASRGVLPFIHTNASEVFGQHFAFQQDKDWIRPVTATKELLRAQR